MRFATYILLIVILTAFPLGASGQIAERSRVAQEKLGADATLTFPTLVLDGVNTTNFTVSMQSTFWVTAVRSFLILQSFNLLARILVARTLGH